jgi:hypothetical protein
MSECDLVEDRSPFPSTQDITVVISQNSKGAVLEEYSTFSAVSQFTLEEYSWKQTYGTLNSYTRNDVTLVAISR